MAGRRWSPAGRGIRRVLPTEAERAVEWITAQGILWGDGGDLMLDQPLTRRQAAVMLYRFADK